MGGCGFKCVAADLKRDGCGFKVGDCGFKKGGCGFKGSGCGRSYEFIIL